MDDWFWELLLLLHPQRFQFCEVCSGVICLNWNILCVTTCGHCSDCASLQLDDVAAQFLGDNLLHCP